MKFTPENLEVKPLNVKKLTEFISFHFPLGEGEEYVISEDALYENALLNNECCYAIGELLMSAKGPSFTKESHLPIEIRIKRKTAGGYTLGMSVDFTYWIPQSTLELNYLTEKKSLKDFMVGRFNYNPRIIKNTREFLNEVNSQLIQKSL